MVKVSFPSGGRRIETQRGPQVSVLMVLSGFFAALAVIIVAVARFFETLFPRRRVPERRENMHFTCHRPQT